jgi:hypothetical protein
MRQILRMALHEYTRHVLRRRIVIALLMPLFMIVFISAILTVIITLVDQSDRGAIAYVDPVGALSQASAPADALNTLVRVGSIDEARAMLRDGTAIAAYALAPDFGATRSAELIFWERRPSRDVERAFERFAATSLLADQPPEIRQRIIEAPSFTFESSDGTRHRRDRPDRQVRHPDRARHPLHRGPVQRRAVFDAGGDRGEGKTARWKLSSPAFRRCN